MDCRACEDLLIDHACKQLDDTERTEVARHLASCSNCALEYCRLQADLEGIVEAHAEAPRARVYHRLRRRVAAELGPPWWTRPWQVLRQPIPVYGAVLVSAIPLLLWIATAVGRGADRAPAPRPTVGEPREAILTDYDATSLPLPYRDVL